MRNLQYEISIYKKNHNKATMASQVTYFDFCWLTCYFKCSLKYSLIHKNSNHTLYVNCNCDCIMAFLANSTFILQISHAKTFKMRYIRCRNNNLIRRYSQLHFMYGSNFYESDFTNKIKRSKCYMLMGLPRSCAQPKNHS